jgi:aspartate aminotransferase
MSLMPISRRIQTMMDTAGTILQFLTDRRWDELRKDPLTCDFMAGNPQEFPLEGITAALQKWAVPQNKDWFAYKMSERPAREVITATLRRTHGILFDQEDIILTTGAFGALSAVLGMIIDPGDEIIYISPPWFFYEMLITAYYGQPVRVPCDRSTFDLDIEAIGEAITPKTRGIIINSPNNPTGRIYPPETLKRLSEMLTHYSRENERSIYLISDEAYSRIVYDGRPYYSPTVYYPNSFLVYTYGKTLLDPGQRLGYIALPPSMPDREIIRTGIMTSMVGNGFTFPNALMQYALPDLEDLSIDIHHLQEKRDRLVKALINMGYELHSPEGTFYLLVKTPIEDDVAFINLLAENKVLCSPGTIFEMPGYFRISLTASDEMIDRALPVFETVRTAISAKVDLNVE